MVTRMPTRSLNEPRRERLLRDRPVALAVQQESAATSVDRVRGVVVDIEEPKTVNTQTARATSGDDDSHRPRGRGLTTVTLWGKWTENAAAIETGMEIAVYDPDEREYAGEHSTRRRRATSSSSRISSST